MGNPYTSVTVTGYNATPPADDGSQTAANRINWSKHKTKLGDPLKTAVESINTNVQTAFTKIALNNSATQAPPYTVLAADQGKLIRATGAGTITTPAAATVGTPFMFAVSNEHTAAVTIDGSGSETIDGAANISLDAGQAVIILTDGTNWFTAANFTPVGAAAGEVSTADQDWTALASSGTVNIGAAATTRVNITGTTTITAFDTVTAGISREVRFDGALTLTHNGTSLILPGAANITTAAGDVAEFVSEGSGNWRCTKYQKASGLPVISQGITLETMADATNGGANDLTEVGFTGIPSGTNTIVLMLDGLSVTGTDSVHIQIGDSGGYETTGYNGIHANIRGTPGITSPTSGFTIALGATGQIVYGRAELSLMDSSTNLWVCSFNFGQTTTTIELKAYGGSKALSAELDRIRIKTSGTDTFDSGNVNIAYL